MKERPILFQGDMVRAILAGTKTQTRRLFKQPRRRDGLKLLPQVLRDIGVGHASPYGIPGDRLWVRETWARNWNQLSDTRMDRSYVYRADGETRAQDNGTDLPWRPSIHMPRAASRITLEVTGVRVERLQAISRGDAMAEGCPFPNMAQGDDPRQWYRDLWERINGADSWAANPWVWVVEFRRLK